MLDKSDEKQNQQLAEQTRREFLGSLGKFAAITPVAMSALMSPATSAAPKSCRGWKKRFCDQKSTGRP